MYTYTNKLKRRLFAASLLHDIEEEKVQKENENELKVPSTLKMVTMHDFKLQKVKSAESEDHDDEQSNADTMSPKMLTKLSSFDHEDVDDFHALRKELDKNGRTET